MSRAIPAFDDALLEDVCDVLGDTDGGLTNKQIDRLLTEAGIVDPNPQPRSPHLYRIINKRDRLRDALKLRQVQDGCANQVLHFVELSMRPVRYRGQPKDFEQRRGDLNEALSFASLEITPQGKVAPTSKPATTVDQARARGRRFRNKLADRDAHQRVLGACAPEIADENYFHAVFEGVKSVAEEIRQKTGLGSDGRQLVDQAFGFTAPGYPRLAVNSLGSKSEVSEHRGVADMIRGLFGAVRNVTAHEPKTKWHIGEQDALDTLAMASVLHRHLDRCAVVPAAVQAGQAGV